ncbi:MAG: molybdopterin converting factor subunit 1 [Rhodospirillales bacterium]|nr:MAG: molybdopterin converting factor subunit 1 [Rhodospirillales bacterium]
MKILYFAWLRQRVGAGEETVDLPADVKNVGQLIDWLKTRGPAYQAALSDTSAIRVAVNHEFAGLDAAIAAGDEIALFPPMTGG